MTDVVQEGMQDAQEAAPQTYTITGEREDLLASLTPAERFVSRHSSNQALQNIRVKFNSDEGVQIVEATDLSMSFRGHLWAMCDVPEVDLLVHPKLRAAVDAMPNGQVTIKRIGGELEVRGKGKSRYTVPLADGTLGNVTPGMEDVDWDSIPAVDAKDALEAMGIASRYVAKNEQNPSITGVNLTHDGDQLVVKATDGIRLVEVRVDQPAEGFPFGEQDVTLPPRMVNELIRLFPEGELKLSADDRAFYAAAPKGGTYFQSRRIGGKFPDTGGLFPSDGEVMLIPRADLAEALRKLVSVAGGKTVSFEVLDGGSVHLHARGDQGEAEEYIDLSAPSPKVKIGFNLEYLSSATGLIEGDTIKATYTTPLRPVLMEDSDGGGRRVLMMPVRVP